MTVPEMRKVLRQYRLERHLSYEQLAAEIGLERLTGRTLRRFVEGDRSTKHQETTLYEIAKLVARIRKARDDAPAA